MIEIGQKRGSGLQSQAIEKITDSPYSHTLVRFNFDYEGVNFRNEPVSIKPGSIIEAWSPFVRKIDSLSEGHEKGTAVDFFTLRNPLNQSEFSELAKFLCRQVGKPYDWPDVKGFIPGIRPFIEPPPAGLSYWNYDKWFCSCLASAALELAGRKLFNFRPVWKIEPGLVPDSLQFNPEFTTVIV